MNGNRETGQENAGYPERVRSDANTFMSKAMARAAKVNTDPDSDLKIEVENPIPAFRPALADARQNAFDAGAGMHAMEMDQALQEVGISRMVIWVTISGGTEKSRYSEAIQMQALAVDLSTYNHENTKIYLDDTKDPHEHFLHVAFGESLPEE